MASTSHIHQTSRRRDIRKKKTRSSKMLENTLTARDSGLVRLDEDEAKIKQNIDQLNFKLDQIRMKRARIIAKPMISVALASNVNLTQDFKCPICMISIMKQPSIIECGHMFCKKCISHHKRISPDRGCPCCRQNFNQIIVNNQITKMLNFLRDVVVTSDDDDDNDKDECTIIEDADMDNDINQESRDSQFHQELIQEESFANRLVESDDETEIEYDPNDTDYLPDLTN